MSYNCQQLVEVIRTTEFSELVSRDKIANKHKIICYLEKIFMTTQHYLRPTWSDDGQKVPVYMKGLTKIRTVCHVLHLTLPSKRHSELLHSVLTRNDFCRTKQHPQKRTNTSSVNGEQWLYNFLPCAAYRMANIMWPRLCGYVRRRTHKDYKDRNIAACKRRFVYLLASALQENILETIQTFGPDFTICSKVIETFLT